jgi:prepilin-type N-terminal cleavage/methylation domain-containing protein
LYHPSITIKTDAQGGILQMLHNLRKKTEGFTIIEVMIVLAIAGLILLIVFLAVPALQRTARNTQRKEDAAAIAGAIADYIADNSGQLPNSISDGGTTNQLYVSYNTAGNSEIAKLGFYTLSGKLGTIAKAVGAGNNDGTVYIDNAANPPTAEPTLVAAGKEASGSVSINSVDIVLGEDCTMPIPIASARTASIWYVTETGSGNGAEQCVEQ